MSTAAELEDGDAGNLQEGTRKRRKITEMEEQELSASTCGSESTRLESIKWPGLQMASRYRIAGGNVFDSIAILEVGVEKEQFIVHKRLLTERSAFFKSAMSETWHKDSSSPIQLADDDPNVVAFYLEWLYGGCPQITDTWLDLKVDQQGVLRRAMYASAWIMAERIMDLNFANCVMSALLNDLLLFWPNNHVCPEVKLVNFIYDNTSEHSVLRKLCRDIWKAKARSSWFVGELNHDFTVELAKATIRAEPINRKAKLDLDRSRYQLKRSGDTPKTTEVLQASSEKPASQIRYAARASVLWTPSGVVDSHDGPNDEQVRVVTDGKVLDHIFFKTNGTAELRYR